MNEIFRITVDDTLDHSKREKNVDQPVLKMRRNELNLENTVISESPIFKCSEKLTGMQILLDSRLGYIKILLMVIMWCT